MFFGDGVSPLSLSLKTNRSMVEDGELARAYQLT